ncbi:MAG: hypothetical protein U0L20_07650 [Ruminococcus sp.]|nr:hypothetical protein [Ruminococcus sp.]
MKTKLFKHKYIVAIYLVLLLALLFAIYCYGFKTLQFNDYKFDSDTSYYSTGAMSFYNNKLNVFYESYDQGKIDFIGENSRKTIDTIETGGSICDGGIVYGKFQKQIVTDPNDKINLMLAELDGKSEKIICENCEDYVAAKDKVFYADENYSVYVYDFETEKTETMFTPDKEIFHSLMLQKDTLYLIYRFYDYEESLFKATIKTFDINTLKPKAECVFNIDDFKLTFEYSSALPCSDNVIFYGEGFDNAIYTVNVKSGVLKKLGDYNIGSLETNKDAGYFFGNYDSTPKSVLSKELWKLDINTGETKKIKDVYNSVDSFICTDNYVYTYHGECVFPCLTLVLKYPPLTDLVDMERGYQIEQISIAEN